MIKIHKPTRHKKAFITVARRRAELLRALALESETRRCLALQQQQEREEREARWASEAQARREAAEAERLCQAAKSPSVEPINPMQSVEQALDRARAHQEREHQKLVAYLYPGGIEPPPERPPKEPYNPLTHGLNVRSIF
jgi:hypothetical protein